MLHIASNVILVEAVNYYHKELHLGFCSSPRFAPEKIASAVKLQRILLLIKTFSLPSVELFLLHIVWYLFVWICIWLHFRSHNQGQNLIDPFAVALSNKSAAQSFV